LLAGSNTTQGLLISCSRLIDHLPRTQALTTASSSLKE